MKYSKEWHGVINIASRYWESYGGIKAFISSPYSHIALVLALMTIQYWLNNKWWEQTLSILPSLLAITTASLALFLGYGTEQFRRFMAKKGKGEETPPYLAVVTTFVHFSVMQTLAIFIALVSINLNAFPYLDISNNTRELVVLILWGILGFIGYFMFLYSLILVFSVSFSLYRLADWYVRFEANPK